VIFSVGGLSDSNLFYLHLNVLGAFKILGEELPGWPIFAVLMASSFARKLDRSAVMLMRIYLPRDFYGKSWTKLSQTEKKLKKDFILGQNSIIRFEPPVLWQRCGNHGDNFTWSGRKDNWWLFLGMLDPQKANHDKGKTQNTAIVSTN